jgi:hypothetical protein
MNQKYLVAQSNISTGAFQNPTFFYNSLFEFIMNFPFAERQCIVEVENALDKNGYFIFGDYDCPVRFKIYLE